MTTRGGQTGHRPAGRESRGPNRRGRQLSATGQVRNRPGQAGWSSRAPLPGPGGSIKASFLSLGAQTYRAKTTRVADRPRPASAKSAPTRPPLEGGQAGPGGEAGAPGDRPRLGCRGREGGLAAAATARMWRPATRPGARPSGSRRRKPGSLLPFPAALTWRSPRTPLTMFAAAVAERGKGAGWRRVYGASSSPQPGRASRGWAGAAGPYAAAHVTRCPPLLGNRTAWQRPDPADPPHSPTSIPHPSLTPGRRGPPQFPETGEWTQYPSSDRGADQVLPKLGRGGGA